MRRRGFIRRALGALGALFAPPAAFGARDAPKVVGAVDVYPCPWSREDLADVIYDISPAETPLLAPVRWVTREQLLEEGWTVDELAEAPSSALPASAAGDLDQLGGEPEDAAAAAHGDHLPPGDVTR